MITKFYWATRILGYVASFAGILLFLAHQADADPALKNRGLGIVGLGFIAFFASYALRVWFRFGSGRKPEKE